MLYPVPTRAESLPHTGELYVIDGDIVDLQVDAIVSNDDTDGRMWTAVASAIKRAAGRDVERQSVDNGPYPIGDAWSTDGGSLEHLSRIVHVAAMDKWGKGADLATIRRCVRSALDEARLQGLSSIALPAIGTGPNAIPLDTWLPAVADEIVRWLCGAPPEGGRSTLSVLIVLYEPGRLERDVARLRKAVGKAVASVAAPEPEEGAPT
jgi:O-acetyl-ADP-ribose deacetylase (regulator of RNase III)